MKSLGMMIEIQMKDKALTTEKNMTNTRALVPVCMHVGFFTPACTIILNFSTMVQLTLSFLDLQVYMKI